MKNQKKMISANEINRFIYCPYQWYYNRTYGQQALKKKYQALPHKKSGHESNFVQGLSFHKAYYKSYRRRQLFVKLLVITVGLLLAGGVYKWLQR